jgi:hypothetical protein
MEYVKYFLECAYYLSGTVCFSCAGFALIREAIKEAKEEPKAKR